MLSQIFAFLKLNPGTKAKTIGARLGIDRAEVNRLLHEQEGIFQQDADSLPQSRCSKPFAEASHRATATKLASS